MRKKAGLYFLYVLLIVLVERFCYLQTGGFRVNKITSNLSYDAKWEVDMKEENLLKLRNILEQPYYYLGQGGTSYCFVSNDRQYVLKFFKHQHMEPSWLERCKLPLLDSARLSYVKRINKAKAHKKPGFLFNSYLLAYSRLKDETGLIHVQLNRSPLFDLEMTLYDKIGAVHSVNLKDTEFALQKKAELIFERLHKLIANKQYASLQSHIDAVMSLLKARCDKGIHDRDPHLAINFGFIEDKAVEIDTGSFSMEDSTLQDDTKEALDELRLWLIEHAPEQISYLEKKQQELFPCAL